MSENPAEIIVDHLKNCTDARAALVVDGNADEIIERLHAAGWGLEEKVEYIGGKRIRYMTLPEKPGDGDGEKTPAS